MEEPKVFINRNHAIAIGALLLLCVIVFYFSLPNYYQFGDESPTITVVQQQEQQTQPIQHNQVVGNYTSPSLVNVGLDVFGGLSDLIYLMVVVALLGVCAFFMSSVFGTFGRNRW